MADIRTVRRVAVTGGAGFLGTRLIRSLLRDGVQVRAVGHLSQGSPWARQPLPDGLEFHELDVTDAGGVDEAFAGQDLVIHAAAVTHAGSPAQRQALDAVNVGGTKNTIEACRRVGVPTLLHVSTTAAIGVSPAPEAPADETFEYNMDGVALGYGASKRRAEQMVRQANGDSLETIVVNPGFIFGSHGERFRGGEVIARVLQARVVICTNGGLSIVHVDDVVEGIRKAVARGRAGERYILSGDNVSFPEIAEIVCRASNRKKPVITLPNPVRSLAGLLLGAAGPARESGRYLQLDARYAYQFFSSAKARQELGYRTRPFQDIVADYLDHARGSAAQRSAKR